jgi:hypothetical protein
MPEADGNLARLEAAQTHGEWVTFKGAGRGDNPNGEKIPAEAAQADSGWADIQAFLKKQLGN